jgi:hypothetical protein
MEIHEDWDFDDEYFEDFAISKRNRKQPKKLKKIRRDRDNEYDQSNSKKR